MNAGLIMWIYITELRGALTENKLEIKYEVTRGNSYQYGEVLGVAVGRSLLDCSLKCSQTAGCRSVVFDRARMTCTGNRWKVDGTCNEASRCNVTQPVVFASKHLQKTLGLECRNNADCMDANSDCQSDVCDCASGYGYSNSTLTCVSGSTYSYSYSYSSGYSGGYGGDSYGGYGGYGGGHGGWK